jgi:hypothetical protein
VFPPKGVVDRSKIKGHSTDFDDTVLSTQKKNLSIEKAFPGQLIEIKV